MINIITTRKKKTFEVLLYTDIAFKPDIEHSA